jgi:hypothetical protein
MYSFGDLVEVKWPTNTYIGIVIETKKSHITVQTLDNKILTILNFGAVTKLTKEKNDI